MSDKKTRKKRVRRRRGTKKVSKASVPTIEEREQASIDIKDVVPPVYQNIDFKRLNSIPDFTEQSKPHRASAIIGALSHMTKAQLKQFAKDPRLTILESALIKRYLRTHDEDPGVSEKALSAIEDRLEGKARQVVEHTGKDGEAMEVKYRQVPDLESASPEQLDQFINALSAMGDIPTKKVKDEDEEE